MPEDFLESAVASAEAAADAAEQSAEAAAHAAGLARKVMERAQGIEPPAPTRGWKPQHKAALVSGILALASLAAVSWMSGKVDCVGKIKLIIGFWVIAPPLWFLGEWARSVSPEEEETMKHSHELARNIWVAFVIILAAIGGIKWPGGGE